VKYKLSKIAIIRINTYAKTYLLNQLSANFNIEIKAFILSTFPVFVNKADNIIVNNNFSVIKYQ